MNKVYEVVLRAEVENEEALSQWMLEHTKDTDSVKITDWGFDLYQEKYTINLKKIDNDKPIVIDDLDALLCALSHSIAGSKRGTS